MKTKKKIAPLSLVTAIAFNIPVAGSAVAQEDLFDGWSGSASIGAFLTSGNSDTRNIAGSYSVGKQVDLFRHTAFGSIYNAENNDVETANRFDLGYKLDRQISDTMYGFGRLRYDSDDYGNIDGRFSGVVGVGQEFVDDGKQKLSGEIGVGGHKTEFLSLNPVLSDDTLDEFGFPLPDPNQTPLESLDDDGFTLYTGVTYRNALSENLTFNSLLNAEASDSNTYTVWDNSLGIRVSDRVSISLGLLSRHNSDIVGPRGENTDTATRISFVYGI